jgi:hypothetical protein
MKVIEKNKISRLKNNSKVRLEKTEQWQMELEFIALEIPFLLQILKTYPFHNQRPNLFERIQLFIQQLESLDEFRILILDKISTHKKDLIVMNKIGRKDSSISKINQEVLEEEFTNFILEYQQLKWEIFEYSNTVLD